MKTCETEFHPAEKFKLVAQSSNFKERKANLEAKVNRIFNSGYSHFILQQMFALAETLREYSWPKFLLSRQA